MFLPDCLSTPPAIAQLRHRAATTWQQWQPRLQAVGIATIGVMVIAIAATIESGHKTRDAWEWLYPRLLAAYQAFKNYQEPSQAPVPIRFEDEEAMVLPDPSDCFGTEYLPFHSNFKDFVKAVKEQDAPEPQATAPIRFEELGQDSPPQDTDIVRVKRPQA